MAKKTDLSDLQCTIQNYPNHDQLCKRESDQNYAAQGLKANKSFCVEKVQYQQTQFANAIFPLIDVLHTVWYMLVCRNSVKLKCRKDRVKIKIWGKPVTLEG